MNEDLIGYLIGALDRDAVVRIEKELSGNPELQRELERIAKVLRPLASDAAQQDPPGGLADRTVRRVFQHRQPESLTVRSAGHWRLADLALAAGILMTISLIIMPAINESRRNRALLECRNNLRGIGVALGSYAEKHSGYLPFYETNGPLSVAGICAPMLLECQFALDRNSFQCPGASDRITPVPTLTQLRLAQDQIGQLEKLLRVASGSYGSLLGSMDRGRYLAPRIDRIGNSLAADRPCRPEEGDVRLSNSHNHAGWGQNVLHRDGGVAFYRHPRECPGCDDFFVNQRGRVEPGVNVDDSVIGTSETKICPEYVEKF